MISNNVFEIFQPSLFSAWMLDKTDNVLLKRDPEPDSSREQTTHFQVPPPHTHTHARAIVCAVEHRIFIVPKEDLPLPDVTVLLQSAKRIKVPSQLGAEVYLKKNASTPTVFLSCSHCAIFRICRSLKDKRIKLCHELRYLHRIFPWHQQFPTETTKVELSDLVVHDDSIAPKKKARSQLGPEIWDLKFGRCL